MTCIWVTESQSLILDLHSICCRSLCSQYHAVVNVHRLFSFGGLKCIAIFPVIQISNGTILVFWFMHEIFVVNPLKIIWGTFVSVSLNYLVLFCRRMGFPNANPMLLNVLVSSSLMFMGYLHHSTISLFLTETYDNTFGLDVSLAICEAMLFGKYLNLDFFQQSRMRICYLDIFSFNLWFWSISFGYDHYIEKL